jgi:hypothetical protein
LADEARWHEALALYDWLLSGVQNTRAVDGALDHWLDWHGSPAGQKYKSEIASTFVLAIDAGREQAIVDLYARPLRRPLGNSTATSEGGFGNYLAHQLLHERKLDDATELAFDRFLHANMYEKWLSRGQYTTAAHWLKLRFWNFADPKPAPFDVVRRALDYIPDDAKI